MREIKLANNRGITLVDDEYYDMLIQYHWSLDSSGYAQKATKINDKWIPERIHKLLIDIPKGLEVDHINNNRLDNQKSNLRIVTRSQNMMNKSVYKNSTSKFKGVSWNKNTNKWRSVIGLNGKYYHLGVFENEFEAAKAYNKKAIELFKEFANLNIIGDD